jgi:hypothetical protein
MVLRKLYPTSYVLYPLLPPGSCLLTPVLNKRTQFRAPTIPLTLTLPVTYLNRLSSALKETNPISPHIPPCRTCPRPIRILTPPQGVLRTESCLLTPVLNKRTQFLPPNTTLTSFKTTTYLYDLCPALNRTNPISPPSIPVPRPSKF